MTSPERTFYRSLVALGHPPASIEAMRDPLARLVALVKADQGYLQIGGSTLADRSSLWIAHDETARGLEMLHDAIPTSSVTQVLHTGQRVDRILTRARSQSEPRRTERTSAAISAVLCVPIRGQRGAGALYLHRHVPGGAFSSLHRSYAEELAQFIESWSEDPDRVPRAAAYSEDSRTAHREHAEDPDREPDDSVPGALQISTSVGLDRDGIVGQSAALTRVLDEIALIAPFDIPVLLSGEPGTGKTVLAELIHRNSHRKSGPFVRVSCANLPGPLIESELFGHERGAFTDARKQRIGRVGDARGGTLFLDEIGEIPIAVQASLLRLLDDGHYHRLGGNAPRRADVRIVCATNRDLEQAVSNGTFRRDLFDRIRAMSIRVPALRDRPEDLSELARSLVRRTCRANRLRALELSPRAEYALRGRPWTGNVRELWNCVQIAAIRASLRSAKAIEAADLFPGERHAASERPRATLSGVAAEARRNLLSQILEETGWNVSEAAVRLGVARTHVHRLITKFELRRPPGPKEQRRVTA